MKNHILGALAFSQIRRKKVRTVITILAMVLSSSLLTATVNFVASGNAMLVNFLGKDYGEYGGAYTLLLLIPAVILGMLIIAMSVIVISNVFRMSASERVAEFGTLKCVGATKKQIYQTVMYEGLFLCMIAIPLGVLLGYLFSFIGIEVANRYMEELNVLVRAMMLSVTFELSFVFSPLALLVSVLLSAGTVAFSAMLPAKKAMRMSALACIRGNGEENEAENSAVYNRWAKRKRGKKKKTERLHTKGKLDGGRNIEYQLAYKNAVSHNKKMKSAVTAFSFSILLFVTMSGLKTLADGITDYISVDYGYNVMADYTSNFHREVNENTGRLEPIYVQTIHSELAQEITEELAAYEGNEIYGMGQDYFTYEAILREDEMTEELREVWEYRFAEEASKKAEFAFPVEIIVIDKIHYREICDLAGAVYGSTILLNNYKYNHRGTEKHITPLPLETSSLRLEKADGSATLVEIDGILTKENVPPELIYPNMNPVRLIVPQAEVRGYEWMASPKDEEGYMAYAKAVLERHFPQNGQSYGEAGFVCRVFGTQDFTRIMNIAIVLASFFLYGFVLLLGVIGVLNVITTMSFDIRMRAREFAVLQSVGMTSGSLQKMLNMESVFCAGKALVTGLPVGVLIVLLMKYCVQQIIPIPFRMPWGTIFGAVIVSVALMGTVVQASLRTLKNQNLIETIRM